MHRFFRPFDLRQSVLDNLLFSDIIYHVIGSFSCSGYIYNGNEVLLRIILNACHRFFPCRVMRQIGQVIRVCILIFSASGVKTTFVGARFFYFFYLLYSNLIVKNKWFWRSPSNQIWNLLFIPMRKYTILR